MNKKAVRIIISFVVVTAGAVVFALTRQSNPRLSPVAQESPRQTAELPKDNETATSEKYVTYTPEVIANTPGTKVLFFHAPWCSQCRSIESGITDDAIPSGTTIIKVDYDSNQALRQKYGVTLQTTFVKVDDTGNLIDKFVAYDDPYFPSVKRNFL